jgi:hypothetical protein
MPTGKVELKTLSVGERNDVKNVVFVFNVDNDNDIRKGDVVDRVVFEVRREVVAAGFNFINILHTVVKNEYGRIV